MRWLVAMALVIATTAAALACEWDADTLRAERARFPSALELITGKFLRHSAELYRWRIADREARLAKTPDDPALLDDLAVAYAKTGDVARAIATMQRAWSGERVHRYETAANLGTFAMMAGDPDDAIRWLTRALELNPAAHFGRERYQLWLIEYARQLPGERPVRSFFAFVMQKANATTREAQDAELPKAIAGLLGIMRFADHTDPTLLAALGDLLLDGHTYAFEDAKQLAARAYLRAGGAAAGLPAAEWARTQARRALDMQTIEGTDDQMSLAQVEAELGSELAEADAWYAGIHDKELEWIRTGANPEVEFDKLYASEPAVIATMNAHDAKIPTWKWLIYVGLSAVSVLVMIAIARRFRANA